MTSLSTLFFGQPSESRYSVGFFESSGFCIASCGKEGRSLYNTARRGSTSVGIGAGVARRFQSRKFSNCVSTPSSSCLPRTS